MGQLARVPARVCANVVSGVSTHSSSRPAGAWNDFVLRTPVHMPSTCGVGGAIRVVSRMRIVSKSPGTLRRVRRVWRSFPTWSSPGRAMALGTRLELCGIGVPRKAVIHTPRIAPPCRTFVAVLAIARASDSAGDTTGAMWGRRFKKRIVVLLIPIAIDNVTHDVSRVGLRLVVIRLALRRVRGDWRYQSGRGNTADSQRR